MPVAARPDSEYRSGALGSSTSAKVTCDDEHTPSALGHSEEAAVENPPCHAVPDVGQRSKQLAEVPTAVRGEQSGYVLDEKEAGSNRLSDSGELEEQAASVAREPRPSSCDGEVLTRLREASAEEINPSCCEASGGITSPRLSDRVFSIWHGRQSSCASTFWASVKRQFGNIIADGDSGESLGEDGPAVLVPLAQGDVPPPGAGESEIESPDT